MISPVSASIMMALTVKSRRAAASFGDSVGMGVTSKSVCALPVRRSTRGRAKSKPLSLSVHTPKRSPEISTSPKEDSSA